MSKSVIQKMKVLDFILRESEEILNSRNKVIGYAVKSVDFDKKKTTLTRRIFKTYKQQLLNDKLIYKIPISDKRQKPYSITPLGICYLIQKKRIGVPIGHIKKMFDILKTFYENRHVTIKSSIFPSKKLDFNEIIKEIEKVEKHVVLIEINRFFGRLIAYTKPIFETEQNSIIIKYLASYNVETIIAFFNIYTDRITLCEKPIVSEQLNLSSELKDDEEFHTYLSMYFLCGICYHVAKQRFEDFMGYRIFCGVNDFKYSDGIEGLEKTKSYDKKVLELVSLIQGQICDNLSVVLDYQKFYQDKLYQYYYDIEPKSKKIYMFKSRILTEFF